MKKIILISTLALALVVSASANPVLSCVSSTTNSITLQFKAGAEGAPYGFDIYWTPQNGRTTAQCWAYDIPPNQTVTVTIVNPNPICVVSGFVPPTSLDCGTEFQLWAVVHVLRTTSPMIECDTQPCPNLGLSVLLSPR